MTTTLTRPVPTRQHVAYTPARPLEPHRTIATCVASHSAKSRNDLALGTSSTPDRSFSCYNIYGCSINPYCCNKAELDDTFAYLDSPAARHYFVILRKDRSINQTDLTLLIVAGYAGSGKTEASKILARQLGWAVLDKDALTRPFVTSLLHRLGRPTRDRESQDYLQKVRPLEYECLLNAAYENIECGISIIVTGPFIQECKDYRWHRTVAGECRARKARLLVYWVRSDPETMHRTLGERGAARDSKKLAAWAEYLESTGGVSDPPAGNVDGFIVNVAESPEPMSSQLSRLATEIRGHPRTRGPR